MKRRLLSVAATPSVAALIRRTAARHPFLVTEVGGLIEAFQELSAMRVPDLIVVEESPACDGVGLLRRLRRGGSDALVMVVARGAEKAALRVFREGADDVVFPNSSPDEVHARLGVMVRRLSVGSGAQRLLPELTLDRETMRVVVGRRKIGLTATEFQILHLLARKSGRVLTRTYLVAQVWNTTTAVRTRSIDVHVSHLRRKLAGAPFQIQTVRPAGYRLERAPRAS